MVFVYTAMGVLCVEHANGLELCYIELLSGDSSPYSILSVYPMLMMHGFFMSSHEREYGVYLFSV